MFTIVLMAFVNACFVGVFLGIVFSEWLKWDVPIWPVIIASLIIGSSFSYFTHSLRGNVSGDCFVDWDGRSNPSRC